jgi:hypothetical protein
VATKEVVAANRSKETPTFIVNNVKGAAAVAFMFMFMVLVLVLVLVFIVKESFW